MTILEHSLFATRYQLFHPNMDFASSDGPFINGVDMLQPETLNDFLTVFGHAVQSSRKEVTGSLFIKRYVTLIAGALYAFSYHDRCLDISLEHIRVVLTKDRLQFVLNREGELPEIQAAIDRDERRRIYYHHLYHDNIKPVWSAVIQSTGIGGSTLWATLSYLIAYWKSQDEEVMKSAEVKNRVEADYVYFTNSAWMDSFADCPINPIYSQFKEVQLGGSPVLIRAKCCLQHFLPGEERYCYTCPNISEEERRRKYQALHQ